MALPHTTLLLLSLLLLCSGTARAGLVNRGTGKGLAISTKICTEGLGNVVEKDRARIQSFMEHGSQSNTKVGSSNITNSILFYTVEVGVGTPPTYHRLLVDTGSSNTWIGASQKYAVTNSSVDTGNSVSVRYGSGEFYGEEWLDTVTLTPDLVVSQQSLGVASFAGGINGNFDGILGLGPIDLTQGYVQNTPEVPTVPDNLYAQGKISQEVVGVFFSPPSEGNTDGKLTFGGHDESLITSSVQYVPLTTTMPAAKHWGFNQTIFYGKTAIMSSMAGVVDTGTTLIYVPSDTFQKYQSLTGGVLDSNINMLTITASQYAKLQTLTFKIGHTSYGLTPNGQIWPRSLNTRLGGSSSAIYLIVNDIGIGADYAFCNGYTFLQRFYSVFDTTNQRIGFAETIYTKSTTN